MAAFIYNEGGALYSNQHISSIFLTSSSPKRRPPLRPIKQWMWRSSFVCTLSGINPLLLKSPRSPNASSLTSMSLELPRSGATAPMDGPSRYSGSKRTAIAATVRKLPFFFQLSRGIINCRQINTNLTRDYTSTCMIIHHDVSTFMKDPSILTPGQIPIPLTLPRQQ